MDYEDFGCDHQSYRPCKTCIDEVITPLARLGAVGHLCALFMCLFNFEFYGVIVEFFWIFQRIFNIGDYAEDGLFKRLGIDLTGTNRWL